MTLMTNVAGCRSRLATDHGRGTRALAHIHDKRYLQDRPSRSASKLSALQRDPWRDVSGTQGGRLELPARFPDARR